MDPVSSILGPDGPLVLVSLLIPSWPFPLPAGAALAMLPASTSARRGAFSRISVSFEVSWLALESSERWISRRRATVVRASASFEASLEASLKGWKSMKKYRLLISSSQNSNYTAMARLGASNCAKSGQQELGSNGEQSPVMWLYWSRIKAILFCFEKMHLKK